MEKFFHASPSENRESIEKNGFSSMHCHEKKYNLFFILYTIIIIIYRLVEIGNPYIYF
mgnify:CR=1 FL=1